MAWTNGDHLQSTQRRTTNGFSPYLAQHMGNVAVDYQNGIFAGTNNLVEVIGDRTPMTVEDYVITHKEAFAKDGPLTTT
jgi:NAD(P)H dehydrogenase (quinone)